MSVYNDYMVKLSAYIVALADHYSKLISQGADCCCVKRKLQLLNMYFDLLTRSNSGCITDAQLAAITNHIGVVTGYFNWGTLTSTTQITPPTIVPPVVVVPSYTSYSFSVTIGTSPTVISFDNALGVSGTSWALTYIATSSSGDSVFVKSITSRTSTGFIVDAYEDNVHFEGTASLIV